MGYPPAAHLLAVLMTCADEALLNKGANYLKEFAARLNRNGDLWIIGPATPSVGKVNDVYRKVVYLKSEKYDTLIRIKNKLEQYIEVNPGYQTIRIQFDFDPMNVF